MASKIPVEADRLYYMGWLLGVVTSGMVYYALCRINTPESIKRAASAPFESWADEQRDLLDRTEYLPQVPVLKRSGSTGEEEEESKKAMKSEVRPA